MKTAKIRPVRGTRDFYPETMVFRQWLVAQMQGAAQRYGYQQWEGPILETFELYAAKSGDELAKEQAFNLLDRSGDTLTLRPELTPSLARMVAQRQNELPRPIRWFAFGPFWRYERPQKGRTREFFQWNVDLIGVDAPQADAEIAAVAVEFFRRVGLTSAQIKVQVNNRKLVDAQLNRLGITGALRDGAFKLIDKREKLSPDDWRAYALETVGLSGEQFDALQAVLEDGEQWRESPELVAFFDYAGIMGIREWIEYAPQVIRGLDYYTGTVYEARDVDGEFRAILGGGRYDGLVSIVGGQPMAATGFAMGDVVIELVLEKYGCKPALPVSPAQVMVTVWGDAVQDAVVLATELRDAGLNVELYPEPARLDKQLKVADAKGIPFAAIAGPDEVAAGRVMVKDLRRQAQTPVARAEVAKYVQENLVRA
jgi:histidyl-tRNA synthetase